MLDDETLTEIQEIVDSHVDEIDADLRRSFVLGDHVSNLYRELTESICAAVIEYYQEMLSVKSRILPL